MLACSSRNYPALIHLSPLLAVLHCINLPQLMCNHVYTVCDRENTSHAGAKHIRGLDPLKSTFCYAHSKVETGFNIRSCIFGGICGS